MVGSSQKNQKHSRGRITILHVFQITLVQRLDACYIYPFCTCILHDIRPAILDFKLHEKLPTTCGNNDKRRGKHAEIYTSTILLLTHHDDQSLSEPFDPVYHGASMQGTTTTVGCSASDNLQAFRFHTVHSHLRHAFLSCNRSPQSPRSLPPGSTRVSIPLPMNRCNALLSISEPSTVPATIAPHAVNVFSTLNAFRVPVLLSDIHTDIRQNLVNLLINRYHSLYRPHLFQPHEAVNPT